MGFDVKRDLTVGVSSLVSAWIAMKAHNAWHASFGTSQASIIAITALLAFGASFGYDLWIYLTEKEFSKHVYYASIASTAAIHYLSHVYASTFTVVGDVVFWLFAIGTALQYYTS